MGLIGSIRSRGRTAAAGRARPGTSGPVLIVSASAGAGHVRAAEAVRKGFAAIDVAAEHVDVLDLAPRWVRGVYGGGFRLLAEHAPRVWRGIYSISDGPEVDTARWGPVAHRILFREFRRLLRSQSWEYCLSTHFLPAQLAAGSGATRFGLVVTDFTLHRYWVQPHVREYFVGTPDLAESVRHRVSGALAEPTGIPVDPAFGSVCPRESRAALGLSETDRVVLVMSGGFGLGTDEGAEAALSLAGADVRVLAVCGANVESRERLDALAARDRRLIVRGYVDDVERYMAAADVIVTKPGGLSLSEALAVGRPMVLTRPLPGHEEANARMLERAGAALLARSGNDVRGALDRMLDDPGLRMRMTVPVRALARPEAAANIAAILTTRLRIPVAA